MKCYYCHHREGECFLNIDRMAVILCKPCANRSLTLRNLSRRFHRTNTPAQPQPQDPAKIEKISSPPA